MADARAELRHLRQTVATVAAEHGLAILAAGTHPTALWRKALQTPKERYDTVMDDLQMIGQRNMLCGMHVHVELPDPDERVDVMYRMLPYLPLFVALSTSSPFWQSRATGLKGYRLAAYDELPRTGVPELFRTTRGVRRLCRRAGARRRDRGFKLYLVGDPALAQASDAGTARARLLHAGGGFASRSPRSTARWRAISTAIPGAMPISTRSRAPSWSRTNGGRSATACTAPSSSTARRRHGRRDARPGDRGYGGRRRCARLRRRNQALPRHRRRRHLGRCPARGVRRPTRDAKADDEALRAVTDWIAGATLQ